MAAGKPQVSILMPFRITVKRQAEWLIEAIRSIRAQTYEDWELILVNDHSTYNLAQVKEFLRTIDDKRIVGYKLSEGMGVSAARNLAAHHAQAELILPVDADDLLTPDAIEKYLTAWESGGKNEGIVYTDVKIFGDNFQKVFKSNDYDFTTLLNHLFLSIGGLHRKADWEKVGGWKTEMEGGLEDWEYWITLGEQGVCGYYFPEPLYLYRKHSSGRYSALRSQTGDIYKAQLAKIRDIHQNTYKGDKPMGCCGRGKSAVRPNRTPIQTNNYTPEGGRTVVYYQGRRTGAFFMTGQVTKEMYKVNGQGKPLTSMDGKVGVFKEDVASLVAGRQKDFVVR